MESPVFGELLVLFLMLLCCCRMFLLKYGKVDSLTILAPISVLLSVLQIVAWGADIFSIVIFLISLFCFFTNFRALLRFTGGLYVDHYNFGFMLGAFFVIILSIFVGFVLLIYRPVNFSKKDYRVQQQKVLLSGDFIGGFKESGLFEAKTAHIYSYKTTDKQVDRNQAVIVISDKRGDAIEYFPLMKYLASNGYTVFSGDFYARDLKWFRNAADSKCFRKFLMKYNSFQNKVKFEGQKEFYGYNTKRELEAMVNYVSKDFEEIYVIGDWMSDIALDDFAKEQPDAIKGCLHLSALEGYETVGYGFIQQTNPFFARCLNVKGGVPLNLYDYILTQVNEVMPEPVREVEAESVEENQAESEEEAANDAE